MKKKLVLFIISLIAACALSYQVRAEEYDAAREVWNYLTDQMELTDEAAAGILGNMMTECAGSSLNLHWDIYNATGHYGICQWSSVYYPEVQGASLYQQVVFLDETIEKEFKVFGYKYKDNFSYEDFVKLRSIDDAATAFAKCYERCGEANCEKRIKNAYTAYDYFHVEDTVPDLVAKSESPKLIDDLEIFYAIGGDMSLPFIFL